MTHHPTTPNRRLIEETITRRVYRDDDAPEDDTIDDENDDHQINDDENDADLVSV